MGNPQHLEWLLEGVEAWNARREREDFAPGLSSLDLEISSTGASWLKNSTSMPIIRLALKRPEDVGRVNLTGANLRGADLRGTNLGSTIGLEQSQLDEAIGDTAAILPKGLVHPEHWLDPETPPDNWPIPTNEEPTYQTRTSVDTRQIEAILAHANLHRIQAPVTAEMIRVAIKTALPVGTNDLPQVFRIATDVADILARLEPDKANLEDRIAALEVQVAALTAALQIAEARAEAEAALAEGYKSELEGKDTDVEGFWSSYKKTTGEEVAKHQFFFAKAGFVYYLATLLGPNHPLIKTLFEVLGKF